MVDCLFCVTKRMTFGSKYTTKRLVFVLCPNVLQKLTALPLAGVRVGVGVGVYGEEGRDGERKGWGK